MNEVKPGHILPPNENNTAWRCFVPRSPTVTFQPSDTSEILVQDQRVVCAVCKLYPTFQCSGVSGFSTCRKWWEFHDHMIIPVMLDDMFLALFIGDVNDGDQHSKSPLFLQLTCSLRGRSSHGQPMTPVSINTLPVCLGED